jgi:phage terminase large subunit-like protein
LSGKTWDFSCPDWFERLKEGKTLSPDLPLNKTETDRAAAIFSKFRLPDVPGTPSLGKASGEWLRDIVRLIFGSLDDRGARRVAEIFAMVPKKNCKTTGGAAIMLTALLMNERPRAEFILIGPTQEIADLAFQQAVGMIEADEEGYLQKRFHVQEHLKTINDRRNKARLKIKTFDMKVSTGVKPAGILIDEVHLLAEISFASRMIGQLRGGMISTPESFMVMITTQSDTPPAGVFKAELDYARAVRDGRIKNPRVVPLLYEFPEAMQVAEDKPWANPKNWHMVTPNLGKSITIERLQEDFEAAQAKGDAEIIRWASQHLNLQIGMALHDGRWRGADYWLGAKDPEQITLESLIARSEVIVAGGDGGGLDDLLALTFFGRDRQSKDWLVWGHAWAQSDVLEKRKDIAERLRDFERDGDLTICAREDPTRDIKEFCDLIERVHKLALFPEKMGIGLDPYAIGGIVDELAARGIETDANGGTIVGVRQGSALSPAIWTMERKLKDGTLWHAGQPLLAWCVGNAKAEQRGNAVLITKQTAGKAKIDPLVAAFNAGMLMSRNPEAKGIRKPGLVFL